jgi:Zn-dependent protease with chaperone function
MEQAEFETLVRKMERRAAASPIAYRMRVIAWAGLGFAFVVGAVLAVAGLCVLIVVSITTLKVLAIKLLIVIFPLLYVLLKALWVRIAAPEGERVRRADAPELFALLAELQSSLRTPPIHVVLITPEFNAGVTQVPRLGILGWHRNYLLLGLPLMKGLTVEQFKAVLAHELGHLSRGHARVGNWIYRLRLVWARLDHELEKRAVRGGAMIRSFFHWYAPRFSAVTFPFARMNEYEADAASVRLTSVQSAAQALTSVNVIGLFFDRSYWPGVHAAARDVEQPGFAPYGAFAGSTLLAVPQEDRQRWQSEALARLTSFTDTHPSLTDRLKAIGGSAEFRPPEPGSGSEQLLGGLCATLETRFDLEWRRQIEPSWRKVHEHAQKARVRLSELRSVASPLGHDEALERAGLQEEIGDGAVAALAERRSIVERFPDSLVARFALGRQLLTSDQAEGIGLMESVMAKEGEAEQPGAELLRDYYWRRGEKETARRWHERAAKAEQEQSEAVRERKDVRSTDSLLPHGLEAEELSALVAQLKAVEGLRSAWLVRKAVRYFPDRPVFLLSYTCTSVFALQSDAKTKGIQRKLTNEVSFPGQTFVVCAEGKMKSFRPSVGKVPGAKIV